MEIPLHFKKTFTGKARIIFLGINPGGALRECNKKSVENGNAHRTEFWKAEDVPSKLQTQVYELYKRVAINLDSNDASLADRLMDEAIQSNFIPFRSHNTGVLHEPKESRLFACELWKEVIAQHFVASAPNVIIWHGSGEFDEYSMQILPGLSYQLAPTGWGSTKYRFGYWSHNGKNVYVLGLPQLSRYTIITSEKSKNAVEKFTDEIANALR